MSSRGYGRNSCCCCPRKSRCCCPRSCCGCGGFGGGFGGGCGCGGFGGGFGGCGFNNCSWIWLLLLFGGGCW